jgi:hypothetical protein
MSADARPGPEPAGWRISDGDREAAVQALGEHYATGRLDKAEFDQRSDQVRTAREITPIFTDLPEPHGTVVASVVAAAPAAPDRVSHGRGPDRGRHGWPRGPFRPWLLLVIPLAFLLHAPWLIFVLFVLVVLRPARRWG